MVKEMKLTKFIPDKMRSEMVQELINEMGIRPLSRKIEVNPKTVYNYRHGASNPGDETMAKILIVMKENTPEILEKYLKKLQDEFSKAIEPPIEPSQLEPSKEEEQPSPKKAPPSEESGESVSEEPTEPVDRGSTPQREVSINEIFEELGAANPFDKMKVKNFLNPLRENEELSMDEIIEESGLSREVIEKHLETLTNRNRVEETSPGNYTLKVKILKED